MTELAFKAFGPVGRLELARAYLSATVGIVRRDVAIRLSYRGSVVSENVGVIFMLAIFYFISKLVNVTPFSSPAEYFAFAVVGILVFGIVRSTLMVPTGVRQELVAGTFERLLLSPFGETAATLSLLIFPMLFALALAVVELVFAIVIFGLQIQWDTAPLALPLGVAGALAFAPFALLFAAITLKYKQAPGQNTVMALISLASGMYFPVALLPSWLRWISEVQPFTPTVDLMRHVLIGFPLAESPEAALAKIAAYIVIGIPIGARLVSRAALHGRRRGTILEY